MQQKSFHDLTIKAFTFHAAIVPLKSPVATASGSLTVAPLILIDLITEEGITGHAYLMCYTPLAHKPVYETLKNLEPLLIGEKADPVHLRGILDRAFMLVGAQGFAGMAVAGLDMACWDAQARAAELPLYALLGGENSGQLKAYDSLGMVGLDKIEGILRKSMDLGFRAAKIRLGFPELATDLAVARLARETMGADADIMVDFNQSLTADEAINRIQALAEINFYWVEEPVPATAYDACAAVRANVDTPIQMGENWGGPADMKLSLAYGASDYVMPDAMRIGGVTGWQKAAELAEEAKTPMSSHLFPEISAHLLLVTPTCHWLEYMDLASTALQTPLEIRDGIAIVPDRPGSGLEWNLDAVKQYLI